MNARKEKLLAALLVSPTIEKAAKIAGISEASALRYMKDAEFSAAYRDARRECVSHALTGLQSACGEAVATLRAVACDESGPASSRVSAAKAILELSVRAVEIDDLAARVEMLEAQMETAT
jgi:hypothetical protein